MANTKFLDYTGVSRLVEKIKNTYATKDVATTTSNGLLSSEDKIKIEKINNIIEDTYSYGVIIDSNVSSPTLTRIGNTDFHKSLPIQSKMRGCLLDNDGNVVEYLDSSNWNNSATVGDDLRVFLPDGTIVEAIGVKDVFLGGLDNTGVEATPTIIEDWQQIITLQYTTPQKGDKYLFDANNSSGDFTALYLIEYTSDSNYTETKVSSDKYFVVTTNGMGYTYEYGEESGGSYYNHLLHTEYDQNAATDYEGNFPLVATNLGTFKGRRDGLRGQVMVEIPEHYRRCKTNKTDSAKHEVRISEKALPGYIKVPKMYVSAYEAALDRDNLKLSSVVNTDAQYRGGDNTSSWDGTYRSLLGMPATFITRTNFRTYARNRKSGSTEWNLYTYDVHKAIYWLYVIEYANLNCQADYTAELTAEGYHQGGLGVGVTTLSGSSWTSYNSASPIVPCGCTDNLGNKTGVVTYNVLASNGKSTFYAAPVPRYRGIENPFGHIHKYTDGMHIYLDGYCDVYICSDPQYFGDKISSYYTQICRLPDSGYITGIALGENCDIIPKTSGGSSTTYFCDYSVKITQAYRELCVCPYGGDAHNEYSAGLLMIRSDFRTSNDANRGAGTRLCFIPAETD